MKAFQYILCVIFLLISLVSCKKDEAMLPPLSRHDVIVAFGDSLTYGIGASPHDSYPAVLAKLTDMQVINAGVSGEETLGSLRRLPYVLKKYHPALVVLCIGGNDMLRKRSLSLIEKNLGQLVHMIQSYGSAVVLIGVPMPNVLLTVPSLYHEVAKQYDIPLNAQLLPTLFKMRQYKSDPIHLNAAGYRQFAEGVYAFLKQRGALH